MKDERTPPRNELSTGKAIYPVEVQTSPTTLCNRDLQALSLNKAIKFNSYNNAMPNLVREMNIHETQTGEEERGWVMVPAQKGCEDELKASMNRTDDLVKELGRVCFELGIEWLALPQGEPNWEERTVVESEEATSIRSEGDLTFERVESESGESAITLDDNDDATNSFDGSVTSERNKPGALEKVVARASQRIAGEGVVDTERISPLGGDAVEEVCDMDDYGSTVSKALSIAENTSLSPTFVAHGSGGMQRSRQKDIVMESYDKIFGYPDHVMSYVPVPTVSPDILVDLREPLSHFNSGIITSPESPPQPAVAVRPEFPWFPEPKESQPTQGGKRHKNVHWVSGEGSVQVIETEDLDDSVLKQKSTPERGRKLEDECDVNYEWSPSRSPSPHPVAYVRKSRKPSRWNKAVPRRVYEALSYYDPHPSNILSVEQMSKILDDEFEDRACTKIKKLQQPNEDTPVTDFEFLKSLRVSCLQCIELGLPCDRSYPECKRCLRHREVARNLSPGDEQKVESRCIAMRSLTYDEELRCFKRLQLGGNYSFPVRFPDDEYVYWIAKLKKIHEIVETSSKPQCRELKANMASRSKKVEYQQYEDLHVPRSP